MDKIKSIVVDDRRLNRDLIKKYLSYHLEVEIIDECCDAYGAYEAIISHNLDLIFLDNQMPEINGFELLDEVSVVIFTTVFDQYTMKVFEANALDHL